MVRPTLQLPTLLFCLAALSSCGGGSSNGGLQGNTAPGQLGSLTLEQYEAKLDTFKPTLNEYMTGTTYAKKFLNQVYVVQNGRPLSGPQGACVFSYDEEDTILRSYTKRPVDAQKVVYIHHRKILTLAPPHDKFDACIRQTSPLPEFRNKIFSDQVRFLTSGQYNTDTKNEVMKAVKNLTLRASTVDVVTGEFDLTKRANAPKGIMFEENLKRPFLYRFNFLNKIVNKSEAIQTIALPNRAQAQIQFIVKVDPAVAPQIVYKYIQTEVKKYADRDLQGLIAGLANFTLREWSEPAGFAPEKQDYVKMNDREFFKFGDHINGFDANLNRGDVELTPDAPPAEGPGRGGDERPPVLPRTGPSF